MVERILKSLPDFSLTNTEGFSESDVLEIQNNQLVEASLDSDKIFNLVVALLKTGQVTVDETMIDEELYLKALGYEPVGHLAELLNDDSFVGLWVCRRNDEWLVWRDLGNSFGRMVMKLIGTEEFFYDNIHRLGESVIYSCLR